MRGVILTLTFVLSIGGTAVFPQGRPAESGALLATVSIPQTVLADGQPLPAGQYQVRFTGEWFQPLTDGGQQGMQWVEFVANGRVAGREMALVIPAREIGAISAWHPAAGATRVDMLRSGDFLRVWANRGGTNYLIHLPVR